MVTLEEYLDRKNLDMDSSNTLPGPNTVSANYSNISKVDDWKEFNYKTLRNLYGEILDQAGFRSASTSNSNGAGDGNSG